MAYIHQPPLAGDGTTTSGAGVEATVLALGAKEAGHRSLRRFYKQSAKPANPEQETMERLLLQYRQMGLVKPASSALVAGARNAKNARGQRSRDDRASKQQLQLGLKRNLLIKGNTTSQNIIFG